MLSTPLEPAPNAQKALVRPQIVGAMVVGSKLRATTGKWLFPAGTYLTAWYHKVGDELVYLCDGYNYTIKPRDRGMVLVARVIALSRNPLKNNGVAFTNPKRVK